MLNVIIHKNGNCRKNAISNLIIKPVNEIDELKDGFTTLPEDENNERLTHNSIIKDDVIVEDEGKDLE